MGHYPRIVGSAPFLYQKAERHMRTKYVTLIAAMGLVLAAVVILSLTGNGLHANTVAILLPLVVLMATSVVNSIQVDKNTTKVHETAQKTDQLTSAVQNGGIERPMERVLQSDKGQRLIKVAMMDAIKETTNDAGK